jgi:hypothetical protein
VFLEFSLVFPSDFNHLNFRNICVVVDRIKLGVRSLAWSFELLLEACEGALCSPNKLWLGTLSSCFRFLISSYVCMRLILTYQLNFCCKLKVLV